LQDNKHFEDAFRVYEKGVALFKYPHVRDIWKTYLERFVERYSGTKLERARDLYKQALSQVCTILFLLSSPSYLPALPAVSSSACKTVALYATFTVLESSRF